MALWRQLTRGLHALTHRDAADRDVADEVEHYLEQATAEHLARGLAPADARRAARLEIGNPASLREEVRSSGWEHTIETLIDRPALRRAPSSPQPRLCLRCHRHARIGHRRQYVGFQRREPDSVRAASLPTGTAHRDDLGGAQGRRTPCLHLWRVSRDGRAMPCVRGSRGDAGLAADDRRRYAARARRGSARQRHVLSGAGSLADARPRPPGRRGRAQRTSRRHRQRRVVAPPVRRGSVDPRPADHPG